MHHVPSLNLVSTSDSVYLMTGLEYLANLKINIASALKQGSYYFRQTNKNNPKNLEAAIQNLIRAYNLMKNSSTPNPAALVEILLEIVQVRTEMSYRRRLTPQEKSTYVNEAKEFGERAREYAICSSVIGHLALVNLHRAILLGREAEVDEKLGTAAVEVGRKKENALRDISTSLGALLESGQQDTDRYWKWADEWRVRLTMI